MNMTSLCPFPPTSVLIFGEINILCYLRLALHAIPQITLRISRYIQLGERSAQPDFPVCCSSSVCSFPPDKEGARIGRLLWCGLNPPGVLNSHCYVISCQCGLVRLWVVGGLGTVISQTLSVSQNQWLLCAGLTHPCKLLLKTNQSARPACFYHRS